MASIGAAVRRVKDDVQAWVSEDLVERACLAAEHEWRERVLTPVVLVRLLVLQVLWGNVACRAVTRLSELVFTAQAYCSARKRLPLDVLGYVAAALTQEARAQVADFGRWKGHRVLHVDGTGISMPDEKALAKAYGKPGRKKPTRDKPGFPVMHVLWLFDAATGLIVDFIADKCHTHDMAHAANLHALMQENDVLVGDRAFGSFAHLALLRQQNMHGLFRAHPRQIVDFTPGRRHHRQHRKSQGLPTSRWVKTLGEEDQIVEYRKPDKCPPWMSAQDYAQLPQALHVRELRYRIDRRGFRTRVVTLVTTLLDPEAYPKQELAELYGARWQIETNLKHLKQTLGMDVLHSKRVDGVQKELWTYLIVYNQVRLFMLAAAARQGVPPDRISFIDALDVLRHCDPSIAATFTLIVNTHRPDRHEPRVIKRRKDRYAYMIKPREELRKTLGITSKAA